MTPSRTLAGDRLTVPAHGATVFLSIRRQATAPPSHVEATLPAPLVDVIDETLAPGVDDGGVMVAFVSPGCKPCEDLVLGLSVAAEERRLRREDLFFVVWAMKDADAERMVGDLPGQTWKETRNGC